MKYIFTKCLIVLSLGILQAQSWTEENLDIYRSFDSFEEILKKQNDTTYVINFWATWCAPCVKELPFFEELHDEYRDRKLKVILVSLDFERQVSSRLIPFLNKNKIGSDVVLLLDKKESEWIDRVDTSWSGALPITIIYNSSKRQFFEKSFHSTEELKVIIKSYLNT